MNPQVVGGWIIFFVGVLAVVFGVVLAGIRALLELVKTSGSGVTAMAVPNFGELPAKILTELLKNPYGFVVVLGGVAIYTGLVMVNGGSWFGLPVDDPTPAVSAG